MSCSKQNKVQEEARKKKITRKPNMQVTIENKNFAEMVDPTPLPTRLPWPRTTTLKVPTAKKRL
jgi:hypothetical protein